MDWKQEIQKVDNKKNKVKNYSSVKTVTIVKVLVLSDLINAIV